MRGALRLAITYVPRSLLRGGRRAIVTLTCIGVGAAAVVALQVASLSVADALTVNVRAANGGDIAMSSNSAPLSAADLAVVQRLAGSGVLSQWTAVNRVHVTARTADGRLIPFDAAVVDTTYPIGGQPIFTTPADGNVQGLLRSVGDVLVSSVLADELGVSVGATTSVNGVGGSGLRATVRGIVAQATLEHAAVMYVRRSDQTALTLSPPEYVGVYANVTGDPAPVATQLRQSFPQASVTTVAEAVANADQQIHDFHTYALLAGLVALLVAGVGIQNAMQSSLASRVTEIAVLKAVGYPPLIVGGLFGLEAAVLGALGGVLGSAVGILASSAVTAAVARATGLVASPHVDAGVIVEGIGLGVGATLLFSLLPIVTAVAVRPVGLMRGDLPALRQSAARYAGMLVLVVALFTVLATAVTGDLRASLYLVAGGAVGCGLLGLLFAAAVAALARIRRPARVATAAGVAALLCLGVAAAARWMPALAPIIAFSLGVWAMLTLGPERLRLWLVMAGRSLDRRRARTSVTIVALFAGALAAGLTMTMAAGLHDEISQAIAANGSTNLVAVASLPWRGALLENAARLPGVEASQATSIAAARATLIDGRPLPASGARDRQEGRFRALNGVTGYNLGSASLPPSITVTQGRGLSPADAGTVNVLVDQSLAGPPATIHPGSTITLADATTGTPATMTVVGLYRSAGIRSRLTSRYSPRVLGDESAAQRLGGGDVQTVLSMTIAADRLDSDSVTLQRAVPSSLVANLNDLTVVVRSVLNNLLLVLAVVTAMVVAAGIAVVANGVTLALIERAREVAVLKSIGFGPRHVVSLVILEYGMASFLASAVGVLSIAIALAVLSSQVLQAPIAFSVAISAGVVAASVLVTAGTAWLAARRGAWIRPLAALRNS